MAEGTTQTPVDPSQPVDQQKPGFGPAVRAQAQNQPDVSGAAPAAGAAGALGGTPATTAAPPSLRDRMLQPIRNVESFIRSGQAAGSFWRGILGGALTGMAAGAEKGHFGLGVAAGAAAAQKQTQQALENKLNISKEEQERKYSQALTAQITQNTTAAAWTLNRNQAKAAQEDATFENTMNLELGNRPGAIDLGNTRDLRTHPEDLILLHKQHPELPKHFAQGNIVGVPSVVPVIGPDGKPTGEYTFGGQHSWYVPQDAQQQLIDHDWTIKKFVPGTKPGDLGHYEDVTLEAGKFTLARALQLTMDQAKENATHNVGYLQVRAAELEAKAKMEEAKAKQLEERHARLDRISDRMAQDPTAINLASLSRQDRTDILDMILEKNPKFDEKMYKRAMVTVDDFVAGDTAKNLTYMNTAIRHQAMLGDAARALKNGQSPLLNSIALFLDVQIGKADVDTYNNIAHAVTEETEKAYKGSSPTDVGMGSMKEGLHKEQSPDQAEATVPTLMMLMGERFNDYFRRYTNGVYGHTPDQDGIVLVQPDVNDALKRYGLTPIQAGAPPVPISPRTPVPQQTPPQASRGRVAAGKEVPGWVPDNADGYNEKTMQYTIKGKVFDQTGKEVVPNAPATPR